MTGRARGLFAAAALALGLALPAAGCSKTVDVDPLPADYTSWYRVDTTGNVPGHGDTYRIIYVNDLGRTFIPDDPRQRHEYQTGTIIVKEVHELDGSGGPGPLETLDIMRKLDDADAPSGVDLASSIHERGNGWLFTSAPDATSSETYHDSCWESCHVTAPIDGAFLDYTR